MKLSLCLLILPFFALAQSFPDIPTILQKTDASDPENESHRLFWRTDPGVSYLLTGSTDLLIRSTEEGYPAVAGGPLDFFDFTPSSDPAQKFYRVFRIDEQGPEMFFRYPDDWDYAVPRNSDIFITLSDATAINLSTVSLTVGNGPLITVGENTGLTFSDGVLRYDPGDSVYGDFGEEIPVSFSVTDVVGNLASFDWYFRLESESQVLVPKLVVFGSQKAQEGGQVLSAEQAVISDLLLGELNLQGGEESSYELTAITADQLILTYSGSEVPDFSAGDYVANLCPTRPEEIFYRQITALDVNSSAQVVTLGTTDVDLALLEEGSVDLNNESQIFEVNSEGLLTAIPSLTEVGFYPSRVLNVERALDFSNTAILDSSSSKVANISARESGFAFGGALEVSLETRGGLLRSVDLRMNGLIGASGLFKIQSLAGGVADQQEVFSASAPTQNYRVVYVGQLGEVPVFANFGAEATIRASVTSSAASEVEFGFVRIFQQAMELTYDRGTEPNFAMTTKPVNSEQVPYEFPSDGDLQAKVISEPRINFSIYGVGGMSATVVSKMEIGYEAGSDVPAVASFDAGVDITLSTTTSLPEVSKNWPLWQQEWDLLTDLDQLKTAVSQSGDLLTIEHNSLGKFDDDGEWQPNVKDASFTYGGNLIPGENGRAMDTVPYAYAEFFAATGVTIGENSEQSEVVSENIELPLAVVPEEFQPIPAGSFVMGASLAGGGRNEYPAGRVFVSAFSMGETEVTKAQWDEVQTWASANGYNDLPAGGGEGESHPVHSVNWYDVVKWCNAKSEQDGRTPVYTENGSVYRSGNGNPTTDYDANGYRLPTEAEWEKAARGGVTGQRFPWGDTIDTSQANYLPGSLFSYDLSEVSEPGDGVGTSGVGGFTENGYGLQDMIGNVWEWCGDSYDVNYYSNDGNRRDLKGPAADSGRVVRGGGWNQNAFYARTAVRQRYPLTNRLNFIGFRLAVSQ